MNEELDLNDIALFINEQVYILNDNPTTSVAKQVTSTPQEKLPIAVETTKELHIKTEGANNKGLIFICKGDEINNPATRGFIDKILAATKLQKDDYLLLSYEKGVKIDYILANYSVNKLFFMGIQPFEAGIHDIAPKLYMPTDYQGKNLLYTETIQAISTNEDKKRALWTALKKVFNIV